MYYQKKMIFCDSQEIIHMVLTDLPRISPFGTRYIAIFLPANG